MAAKTAESKNVTAPNYIELMTQAGEAWLAQVAELQESSLKLAERVAENLPKSDAFPLPKVDSADLGVPSVRELVEANFSIMDKYLANQRSYIDRLLKISGS
jgi:hypothetical protein